MPSSTTSIQLERRKILEMVAEGKVTPEQASELLDRLTKDGLPQPSSTYPSGGGSDEQPIRRVRVISTFRALNVVGDEGVEGATATGVHKARTDDEGTLVIESSPEGEDSDEEGFVFSPWMGGRRRFRWSGWINGRSLLDGESSPPVLEIKMNPKLPLEIELTAGAVRVRDMDAPIRADISAGSARLTGVTQPIHVHVNAGSAEIRGRFDRGESEVTCTAGKVQIELEEGSDVRIRARATLGKVMLPDGDRTSQMWAGIGGKETVIGNGTARLDLDATTGAVIVSNV